METSQRDHTHNPPHSPPHNPRTPVQDPDFFAFLKAGEEKSSRSPSFFSENGLGQDILQVTGAEPDICLEVFYALYNTLRPQIEKQGDSSFKNAWTNFIGAASIKGSLCPPEKLLTERRVREIKKIFSTQGGEARIFQYLDQVVNSTSYLKQTIEDFPSQLLHKEDALASLSLVEQFYMEFRDKVTALVRAILEKEQINVSSTLESDKLEYLLELKAIMMSDIFGHHWAYRISRNKAEKLLSLDTHGRNLQSNLNDPASHRVIALPENVAEPLVFFKANGNPPIQPEKEFMLYSLYQHLRIPVPETALLILTDVFEANPDYFYAVQASEAVIGKSPLQVYRDQETIFDHAAYVSQAIGALLTNPSDGSFKNFRYSPKYQTFISIDNDLVFKPEFTGKDENKTANVKSILFLLPQIDLSIPKSTKNFFTTLDPHLTALSWLQDLSRKNKEYSLLFSRLAFQKTRCTYQNLLPQSEVPSLVSCLQEKILIDLQLHNDEDFSPQILVSKDLLSNLVEKLQIIEKTLLNTPSVNVQTLFDEISPLLGKYYRKLRLEFTDPMIALEALWGDKKNDINYSFVSSLLGHEEINSLASKDLLSQRQDEATPEALFNLYKGILASGESPLDGLIRRHNQRRRENSINLQETLRELQLLVQERLTNSRFIRDIIDFNHNFSKMAESDNRLIKEIASLLTP